MTGRGTRHRRAHGVAVVLDDVDYRQVPKSRHVEALVDLALVGSTVAKIGERHVVVATVAVGESQTGAERDLCADDAVAAVKVLFLGEHVHRAALAAGKPAAAAGQLSHDAACTHAASEHMAVITIGGDDLVAFLQRHLHADDDSFLADVEVTETADEAHTIELACFFLETADEEHFAIGLQIGIAIELGDRALCEVLLAGFAAALRLETDADFRGAIQSSLWLAFAVP